MDSETSKHQPHVVMLTADREIDRRILLEADSLEEAGWRVTIIGMPLDMPKPSEDYRIVRIRDGLQASEHIKENLVLHAYRMLRQRLPMNGLLMRSLKALAWRYLADPEQFYVRLFKDKALGYSPQVYVAHDLPMLAVAHLLAETKKAKLVYDSHELYAEQEFPARERTAWSRLEAKHITACDAVITINPSIAYELEQRYQIAQVHVIQNAERLQELPQSKRHFHTTFGLPGDAMVLLYQGGLSASRHLETLVEAMSYVRNERVHLVFLGDGRLKVKLRARALRNGSVNKVHFHPAVSQDILLQFTVSADVGIIPYQPTCLNNRLCSPNKLYEFIAVGLPILATDLTEIKKIVLGMNLGMVGNMETAKDIARLVDEIFADPERLAHFRSKVVDARKQINWQTESKHLIEIYSKLISQS